MVGIVKRNMTFDLRRAPRRSAQKSGRIKQPHPVAMLQNLSDEGVNGGRLPIEQSFG